MINRRVYLRPEGWYYVFVIAFVIGGSVLRNVNLLVALGGLMVAALVIHWQMVVRSLSGLAISRLLPSRICAGDRLDVQVSVHHGGHTGTAWALNYRERLERIDPPDNDRPLEIKLLFPSVSRGETVHQTYECQLTRRGIYRFSKANVSNRFPLGLIEGNCFLDLTDMIVVYPRIGTLKRSWMRLIESGAEGQQSTYHRRGMLEDDFHALREWRTGDSRRWIHWRTSAKIGALAVREFEERRRCDVALILDLWLPSGATEAQRAMLESVVSFAATAVIDLCRHGGSRLTVIVAGRSIGEWTASASPLFAQELLEHLAVCHGDENVNLAGVAERLAAITSVGMKPLVVSTRAQSGALTNLPRRTSGRTNTVRNLEDAVWLSATAGELENYFTLEETSHAS